MCIYICVWVCACVGRCPRKPEGIGSYGIPRDIRGCELPHTRDGSPALRKQYLLFGARAPLQARNYTSHLSWIQTLCWVEVLHGEFDVHQFF